MGVGVRLELGSVRVKTKSQPITPQKSMNNITSRNVPIKTVEIRRKIMSKEKKCESPKKMQALVKYVETKQDTAQFITKRTDFSLADFQNEYPDIPMDFGD